MQAPTIGASDREICAQLHAKGLQALTQQGNRPILNLSQHRMLVSGVECAYNSLYTRLVLWPPGKFSSHLPNALPHNIIQRVKIKRGVQRLKDYVRIRSM